MDHTRVRVFSGAVHASPESIIGAPVNRLGSGALRLPYFVDTGLSISDAITENSAPAKNTRVVLLDARTLRPIDVLGRVPGASYQFRSVPAAELGYYVMGIDLDGVYGPVCQGPIQPKAGS